MTLQDKAVEKAVPQQVFGDRKNGTYRVIALPLEEFMKFQATILQAVGSNMKRMLVVNDMCAIETRKLMRESILSEMNNLNRLAVAELERLCTLGLSSGSSANALL